MEGIARFLYRLVWTEPGETMSRLIVSSRFVVPGVWVRSDALGGTFTWQVGKGRTVSLQLPLAASDFQREVDLRAGTNIMPALTQVLHGGAGRVFSVNLIKVDVEFDAPLSLEQVKEAKATGGDLQPAFRLLDEAVPVAAEAAYSWLVQLRVTGLQPWLGLKIQPPVEYGVSGLVDVVTDEGLVGAGPRRRVEIRFGDLALTSAQLADVRDNVASGIEAETADWLLADARYLVREAEVVDAQRAVLSAAMACEIRAKAVMRGQCDPAQRELVDMVLSRVSNLSDLLDRPTKAIFGVSLREVDDSLHGRVKKLSTKRNNIIHRGEEVTPGDGEDLVAAAVQACTWLDSLRMR